MVLRPPVLLSPGSEQALPIPLDNACYRRDVDPMHRNNPLLEALPERLEPNQVLKVLVKKEPFSEAERKWPTHKRITALNRLELFRFSRPELAPIYDAIYTAICMSYLGRDPFSGHVRDKTLATGLSIIGPTGVGKTTMFMQLKKIIPQGYIHTAYKRKPFDQVQLNYVFIDCSDSGSIKGVALNLIAKTDELIGRNDLARYQGKNLSWDEWLLVIQNFAKVACIGCLVLDDAHNIPIIISEASGKKAVTQKSIARKFFRNLVTAQNKSGLSFVMIAQKEIEGFYKINTGFARRFTRGGNFSINPFEYDVTLYPAFMKRMWRYQFTRTEVPLTPELMEIFYKKTGGNPQQLVILYREVQKEAFWSGRETITYDTVANVADERLAKWHE